MYYVLHDCWCAICLLDINIMMLISSILFYFILFYVFILIIYLFICLLIYLQVSIPVSIIISHWKYARQKTIEIKQ